MFPAPDWFIYTPDCPCYAAAWKVDDWIDEGREIICCDLATAWLWWAQRRAFFSGAGAYEKSANQ